METIWPIWSLTINKAMKVAIYPRLCGIVYEIIGKKIENESIFYKVKLLGDRSDSTVWVESINLKHCKNQIQKFEQKTKLIFEAEKTRSKIVEVDSFNKQLPQKYKGFLYNESQNNIKKNGVYNKKEQSIRNEKTLAKFGEFVEVDNNLFRSIKSKTNSSGFLSNNLNQNKLASKIGLNCFKSNSRENSLQKLGNPTENPRTKSPLKFQKQNIKYNFQNNLDFSPNNSIETFENCMHEISKRDFRFTGQYFAHGTKFLQVSIFDKELYVFGYFREDFCRKYLKASWKK